MSDERPTGLGALAQRVIMLDMKMKTLKAQEDTLKEDLDAAKAAFEVAAAEEQITTLKYHGITVYVAVETFGSLRPQEVKDGDPKKPAMDALKQNDAGFLVREEVNSKRLNAWVREQIDDETGEVVLPEALKPHVKISKKSRVGVRYS